MIGLTCPSCGGRWFPGRGEDHRCGGVTKGVTKPRVTKPSGDEKRDVGELRRELSKIERRGGRPPVGGSAMTAAERQRRARARRRAQNG